MLNEFYNKKDYNPFQQPKIIQLIETSINKPNKLKQFFEEESNFLIRLQIIKYTQSKAKTTDDQCMLKAHAVRSYKKITHRVENYNMILLDNSENAEAWYLLALELKSAPEDFKLKNIKNIHRTLDDSETLLEIATQCIQNALYYQPENSKYWSLLADIYDQASKDDISLMEDIDFSSIIPKESYLGENDTRVFFDSNDNKKAAYWCRAHANALANPSVSQTVNEKNNANSMPDAKKRKKQHIDNHSDEETTVVSDLLNQHGVLGGRRLTTRQAIIESKLLHKQQLESENSNSDGASTASDSEDESESDFSLSDNNFR